jgi:WD40 repeat protein
MNATSPTYDVFLSHNSDDKPAVLEIARRLQATAGIRPFIDAWHLIPGAPWQEALEAAIDASATCAVFLGPKGFGSWENEEMRAALSRRVSEAEYRVIPVLLPGANLPDRGRLPRFLSRLTWVDFRPGLDDPDAFHRLVSGIRGVAPLEGGEDALPNVPDEPPFRGLEAFDEEHADYFFGREALIQQLVEQLRSDRFLAVIGPSGSGKSSLARAGLIPQLRKGALPGSASWPVVVFRPGPHPFEGLAARLGPVVSPGRDPLEARDATLGQLRADERGLHVITQVALASAGSDARLVVLVDQFEEVFTLCRDDAERSAFAASILYASSLAGGQTVVVVTMRADFFGKTVSLPGLAERIADRDVLVTPLDQDELREAIVQPAERVGLQYEKGLVDTILADLGTEPGTLPLLQHTLLQLWEGRSGLWLTTDRYRAIGGVRGAIAQRAEMIYGQFTVQQQAAARRVLLRLTQPGEGTEDTRRRAPISELLPAGPAAADVQLVIDRLADARLLTTDRDDPTGEVVDVAHEALIRGWPRLQAWVDENPEGFRIHRRLTEAADEWLARQRDPSYLYTGSRLTEGSSWATGNQDDLNELEGEFLDASIAAKSATERAARRRTRALIGGLAGGLVIFAILAGVAFVNWQAVGVEQHRSTARLLVSNGQNLAATDPLLGMRIAMEGQALAGEIDPHLQAELEPAVAGIAAEGRTAYLGTDTEDLFTASGSDVLVVSRRHGMSELRRISTGAVVATIDGPVSAEFHGAVGHPTVVFINDGRTGEVRLASDGATVTGPGVTVDFSPNPDQSWFLVNYPSTPPEAGRPSELRRTSDGSIVAVLDGVALGARFSTDVESRSVVVTYELPDGFRNELRRTRDGALLAELKPSEIGSTTFSLDPDATYFVPGYFAEPAELRRTVDGSVVMTFSAAFGDSGGVDFSPDGSIATAHFEENGAEMVRTRTGDVIATLGQVSKATYSPSSAFVALQYESGDSGGELRSTRDGKVVAPLTSAIQVPARRFEAEPSGRWFVVRYLDHSELRDMASGEVFKLPVSTGSANLSDLVRVGGDRDHGYLLSTYDDGTRELRPIADLAAVEHLGKEIDMARFNETLVRDGVFVSDGPAAAFVVDYGSKPAELRRSADASLLGALSATVVDDVIFSSDGHRAVIESSQSIGELADLTTGAVTTLSAPVTDADFSPDGTLLVVTFSDGRSELWDTRAAPTRLAELGLRFGGAAFVPATARVAVRYASGDAYMLDADWLRAMRGEPRALSTEELTRAVCSGPLAIDFEAGTLQRYLQGEPPRACR